MSAYDVIGYRPNHYGDDVVIGTAPGESGTVHLIVTHCKRLTNARRLAIGRRLWGLTHYACDKWDDAPESERLRWTQCHMGRYEDVRIETDSIGYITGYTTSQSSCGGYPAGSIELRDISEV